MNSGRLTNGAELSKAVGGAWDEPSEAVGNSERIMDFILCDLLKFWQQIQIGLLRCDINLGHAGSALGDLAKAFIE